MILGVPLPHQNYLSSPADSGTKKHVYLPYRGAIPFWFYLVPLRLVSIFLNVVRTETSCVVLSILGARGRLTACL